ncbi:MAG: SMP-30/gluconolactonase/LRE family protein [Chitinophagaceae bacterium]
MRKSHLIKITVAFIFWCSSVKVFSTNIESAPGFSFKKNLATDTVVNPNSKIISKNAELKLVSKQFSFTEGPAVDKKGNIFFTDQPNNKIWKYDTNGELSLFLDKAGRSNGMYFDKKGNLISCADEIDQLWSINPSAVATVLVTNYEGQRLNGPNDVWIHPNGNIYITDPYYQRDWWDRKSPDIKGEKVYCLPKGQKELVMVADSFKRPNGIIGTPDGKYLYVADINDSKTYRFTIHKDGSLKERTLFVSMGSDGMTIDEKGNIYITGNGVTVFNNKGEKIEHIRVPAKWTANICFGGKNRNMLFITASESIYTLQMQVRGVN